MSQFTQMSDIQLKQTISQLQSSAGATPRFPTRNAPLTPSATPSYTQLPYPLPGAPIIPPQLPLHSTPLPSTPQALHTTYPSRLRTGTTLLMQPIIAAPSAATLKAGRGGKRINYAEAASGDEDMEIDAGGKEPDSDDSDFLASGGARASIRRESSRVQSNHQTHSQATAQPAKGGLDQTYLGMIPPARFITSKAMQATRHEYPSRETLLEQAQRQTTLIPIRVELETDTHRIRDAFVWNLHEQIISPAAFARIFCSDLDLPAHPYAEQVEGAIRSQIEEWEGVAGVDLRPPLSQPPLDDEEGEEVPDCRVILEIDVQIATQHLLDHIEWDLLSPLTPEAFARTLCADLGLSGESAPLIAHAIHEEILRHKRDAIEWSVIGAGEAVSFEPEEEKDRPRDRSGMSLVKDKTGLGIGIGFGKRGEGKGPRPLKGVFRDWSEMEEWGTKLEELSAEEVERKEIERERAARRLRRETSRFQTTARRRR
ncbi:SNF5-domain-containing protein [Ramaria rubella]|nr:SNF5-domain-containing protein [Ramaria rubella]